MKQLLLFLLFCAGSVAAQQPVDFVNPFIGTTNYGTCNPGAVCPGGLMSVSPFNVAGSDLNRYDKDERWWSTPYDARNTYFTGYSHVNLSGVGCPDLGALLLMPTQADTLCVDFRRYGSTYTDESASPGYYANRLTRYGIQTEVTATPRTARARFTFSRAARSHILLNLGEGLTNESGATVRRTAAGEVEGCKLLGAFCYDARQAVYPLYFVMRIVTPQKLSSGYWKFQRPKKGIEAQFDPDDNRYKIYSAYGREISGDDIGCWFSFDAARGETVEVQIGISAVSIEGARKNLAAEQPDGSTFEGLRAEARRLWQNDLSKIRVEGGTNDEKAVFYTALYHLLLQPAVLNDVDGRYPAMESDSIRRVAPGTRRYTIFSLWDTYRNVHPLLSLAYPQRQTDMMRSILDMERESGQLPRWELFGRESYTMDGDPAIIAVADTWMRGLRGFNGREAYAALRRSAMKSGKNNPLRPSNDDYMQLGFIPLREMHDRSVSRCLEYCAADYALAQMAESLGETADFRYFGKRAQSYRRYFDPATGALRPLLPDGTFLTPFNPRQGENFAPVPGFHEGSSWNYTFAAAHDADGLARLAGGKRRYIARLDSLFKANLYDPANEPDIVYPYLFSFFPGEAARTQQLTRNLLARHFRNAPDGLPGNEDTGTMSAWAVFSMLGFYPAVPGRPDYVVTAPVFERASIALDRRYYPSAADSLIIEAPGASPTCWRIKSVETAERRVRDFRVTHADLLKGLLRIKFD